jgi:hypothetical protein
MLKILVERIIQTTERYQKVNVYIITRAKNIHKTIKEYCITISKCHHEKFDWFFIFSKPNFAATRHTVSAACIQNSVSKTFSNESFFTLFSEVAKKLSIREQKRQRKLAGTWQKVFENFY